MSWPVSINDEIVTEGAAARLRLTDGTVVTVQRNSRLRLESAASRIQVKMLSGSAIEDVKTSRSALGTTTTTSTFSTAARSASTAATAGDARAAAAPGNAVVYRMATSSESSPGARLLMAPSAISTGTFYSADVRNAVSTPGTGTRIVLPNGTILEVTAQSNGSFTIDKINIPATNAAGEPIYVSTTNSSLIGATITAPAPGATGGVTVTTSTGQVLSPTQLGSAVSDAATTAYTETVQEGGLPPGSVPPPLSPVSVGTFQPAEVVSPPGN